MSRYDIHHLHGSQEGNTIGEAEFMESEILVLQNVPENSIIYQYVKTMRQLGYSEWYIGMGVAVLQNATEQVDLSLKKHRKRI